MDGLTIMLGVFINLLCTYTMPNNHYCSTYMMPYPHLLVKHCLKVGRKSRSEAWNLPTCGCKSMMDGLIIMLGVFINLLCTYTMPNNHYCSTYMMPYPHLLVKHCLKVGRKSRSEAWNLPTCGCKSMVEGLTITLRVFINLLYTLTMPNNHYCSTYMMPYPHLMAKHCLTVSRKSRFFQDPRHETYRHVAVKVWWMDLQSCWECSSTCYVHIQCQTTTIAAPTWCHTPTCWSNIAWKSAENRDLRHETCLHVAVKVWWIDLQSCWECSSTCYAHIQCQTATIAAPTWCHTPTWWSNIAWKSAENRDLRHETCLHVAGKVWWRALLSCWECSSTCYTPIQCQTTTIAAPTWCHTPTWWPNIAWQSAENQDFFRIWGMKPAYMWL